MLHLGKLWEAVRSGLWFTPSLIVCAAVALGFGLIEVDAYLGPLDERWPRLFGAGAAGARGLLAAIATSMITIAGVTFSITVVALTLASGQYSSRILRNFMRDRANQVVLGAFVGVFAYCLVILRTVRGGDEGTFVPSLAVLAAVVLAFVAIGFLIFFIHHVAESIQAASVIEAAAHDTLRAIDRLFPAVAESRIDRDIDAQAVDEANPPFTPIRALEIGYIQNIDIDGLFDLACEAGAVVRMERRIGEFVSDASTIASIAGRALDEALVGRVNACYAIGRHRTIEQDVAFGIRQIVDVALKALSPGVNDTTTAVICIDYLGAVLARLAPRPNEASRRFQSQQTRVIVRATTFESLLGQALDEIRQNAAGNVAVFIRLLETLQIVIGQTPDPRRRELVHRHAERIVAAAKRSVPSRHDRSTILAARARIDRSSTPIPSPTPCPKAADGTTASPAAPNRMAER